jgi:ribosome-associated heat shock protein Hsp15
MAATNTDNGQAESTRDRVRIDKWLWAARFFKSRSLAADAVDSGKVLLHGIRIKPAHALKVGAELEIRTPGASYTVHVRQLSEKRGPAAQAALLYEETAQSKEARAQARLEHAAHPDAYIKGRPTKRTRRVLHKVRGQLY